MEIAKKFQVKEVKVSDLKEWEINPRIHSSKGLEDVKESIKRLGMVSFMMVDKDMTIIGGHARKKVLLELGIEKIKCWVAKEKLSVEEFKTASLLSNRIYSSFNKGMINNIYDPFDLIDYGFSASEVDFEEDITIEESELETTEHKFVQYKYKFKFTKEEDRNTFELFIASLRERYGEEFNTNGERFINFLKTR